MCAIAALPTLMQHQQHCHARVSCRLRHLNLHVQGNDSRCMPWPQLKKICHCLLLQTNGCKDVQRNFEELQDVHLCKQTEERGEAVLAVQGARSAHGAVVAECSQLQVAENKRQNRKKAVDPTAQVWCCSTRQRARPRTYQSQRPYRVVSCLRV